MTSSKNPMPTRQMHRHPLPSSCVDFSSSDGKIIFQEALNAGFMECYFRLAAEFRTQDEPTFCGLTTLVMILNALEKDPSQAWKGPWRLYQESMLDCCMSIRNVQQEGITFDEFICLAECNSLHVKAKRATEGTSLECFRDCIKRHVKKADVFVILSYSRKGLNQTGDGHFSPVGGYHENRDLVLILDTARYKYPPHWVPVALMWESMRALDELTGKPRGYMVLSRYEGKSMLTLFRISSTFSVTYPGAYTDDVSDFVTKWQSWLSEEEADGIDEKDLIHFAASCLLQLSTTITACESILTTQGELQCLQEDHACDCYAVLNDLEDTGVYKEIKSKLETETNLGAIDRIGLLAKELNKCCFMERLSSFHFVTILLMCWPYDIIPNFKQNSYAYILDKVMSDALTNCSKVLINEIKVLRRQFAILLTKGRQSKSSK